MKEEIKNRVIERLDFTRDITDRRLKEIIQEVILEISREKPMLLEEKIKLSREVFYALRKLDFLQDLLEDEAVTEIMINGYEHIFVERGGRLYRYPEKFSSEEKLYQVVQQIASSANRMVNEMHPIVDARLEDGSRVNIILPPVSLDGAVMTIRKFAKEPMTLEWLCERNAFSKEVGEFLKMLVRARYNIFISGGTGSGKTTLLNGLSNCIPKDERIITIEDSAELQLNGIENLVRLEMRNANAAGEHQIDMKDLIKAALRSRPDRIIVGEVRGEEALSMLNAMNTGHDGSISTGHANSTGDMLRRIETMVLMGVDMPIAAIRGQMASAIDMILHLGRLPDGSRKLMEIAEVSGIRGQEIQIHPIFERKENGRLEKTGEILHTGKLKEYGQYEKYEELMGKVFHGTEGVET
ncbi:CpaF family protein [Anaerostipes sp.]|uniref:CpaF family protein n=1 Tax=Anaerostipes sp. TaxID=1872530 RepID=UPI00257CD3F0|nr:CpaF family protein [Anaerostipes sp.]